MDTFSIIGFVFGLSGLSFAMIVQEKMTKLNKEFEILKKDLEDSGVIKSKPDSEK